MRVEDFSTYSPLTVEYRASLTDDDQPVLKTAVGSVIGLLLDSDVKQSSKNRSVQLAKKFNDTVGPLNNSTRLKYKLTDTLSQRYIRVNQDAATTLQYRLHNRLSEDGRTLEIVTHYQVIDRDRAFDRKSPLIKNSVHVQYRISEKWSKEELLNVMHMAVEQTAQLIALHLSDDLPEGSQTTMPGMHGEGTFAVNASQFQLSEHSPFTYFSTPAALVAVASDSDDIRVYHFQH